MDKKNSLGELEHVLLLAIMQLGGKSYGALIRENLMEKIDRDVSIGALYATLERMESKEFLKSSLGEPTAVRGGRAKRYFEVTAKGRKSLKKIQKNKQKKNRKTEEKKNTKEKKKEIIPIKEENQ
eukprot:TRINITY_DN83756_c1_g1_i1.p2 TRINITY_DN83756_c1_g1~~TRINITY_DN83756_c1_g1_i1.p2  ORF type:complete len:125 (-),score=17.96 TRINITY_DN83756_c1_g1_i1:15-389(-)